MFQNIKLSEVDPNPDQPREYFTGIDELAASIAAEGLLEPVMVRPAANGRYELVHGERRYRASLKAGLESVPAVIRQADDATTFRLSVVENVQRSALTPMEEARAFTKLQKQGHTQAEIGQIIGKGQSYVAHKLRLLKAPPPLTHYLERGILSENHFRQAMRIKNILGEGLADGRELKPPVDYSPQNTEENKAVAVWMAGLRPVGKALIFPPSDVLTTAWRSLLEYVSKHNPPLWEYHAFWALSAMAAWDLNVIQATRFVDRLQEHWFSALVQAHMENLVNDDGRLPMESWKPLQWAIYHDLKHSGLLSVARGKDTSDAALHIRIRAIDHVAATGSLAWPSEAQGSDVNAELREEVERHRMPAMGE